MAEWTKEMIRERLAGEKMDTRLIERAIVELWKRQTADEQISKDTSHSNGMGFTGADAFILTAFAEWIQKCHKPEGQKLSPKQLAIATKKLPKYAGQLLIVHQEKMAQQAS